MAETTRKPADAAKAGADDDAAKKAAEQQSEPEPEKHSIEALIEGSQAWLGYSPHLAAGAFAGQHKKHLTLDEARELTKAYAHAEIKLPSAEEDEAA